MNKADLRRCLIASVGAAKTFQRLDGAKFVGPQPQQPEAPPKTESARTQTGRITTRFALVLKNGGR